MVPQNAFNINFEIFLKKQLFKKMDTNFIKDTIIVLLIKFYIFKIKTVNLS